MKIEEEFNHLIVAVDKEDVPVRDFLKSKGMPTEQIICLIFFTQLAWGRETLRDHNLILSPNYCCFDQHGEVVRSGKLKKETYFVYAKSQIQQYKDSMVFQKLAYSSAECNALRVSLCNEANPRNLAFTPAYVFLEDPTEEGLKKLHQTGYKYTQSFVAENSIKGNTQLKKEQDKKAKESIAKANKSKSRVKIKYSDEKNELEIKTCNFTKDHIFLDKDVQIFIAICIANIALALFSPSQIKYPITLILLILIIVGLIIRWWAFPTLRIQVVPDKSTYLWCKSRSRRPHCTDKRFAIHLRPFSRHKQQLGGYASTSGWNKLYGWVDIWLEIEGKVGNSAGVPYYLNYDDVKLVEEFLEKFGLLLKGRSLLTTEDGSCTENVLCRVCDDTRAKNLKRFFPQELVPPPSEPLQVSNKNRRKSFAVGVHSVTCENKDIELSVAYVAEKKAIEIQLFVNSCLVDRTYMRNITGSFHLDGFLDFGDRVLPVVGEVFIPFWTRNIIRISVNSNVIYETKVFGF